MEEQTVEKVKRLVQELWTLRRDYEEKDLIRKAIGKEYDQKEAELLNVMEVCELDRFDGPDCAVFRNTRSSVATPKTEAERLAFFGYLKKIGEFDNLITVNSQTLNSWYKAELQAAEQRGDIEFDVPGLNVTTVPTLTVRKK